MLPTADQRYQGYIARWYSYYSYDSYFNKLIAGKNHLTRILTGIWITFSILNLLIPVLSITRGKQIFQRLTKVTEASNQRVYRAAIFVMILFNMLYTLLTIIMHIKGHPNILECNLGSIGNHQCKTPPTATSYMYVLGMLNTKAVILPIAVLIELVAAVCIAKGVESLGKRRITQKLILSVKVIVIWQLFIFVQITVGLIGIPLLVWMFISPARVLLITGGITLIFTLLIFMLTTIPFPTSCKYQPRRIMQSFLFMAETIFIVALFISAYMTYYLIVQNGMNMDGVKGYTMSLIPTILISIAIWIIKMKYLGEKIRKMKKQKKLKIKRGDSLPTGEELINLSELDCHT